MHSIQRTKVISHGPVQRIHRMKTYNPSFDSKRYWSDKWYRILINLFIYFFAFLNFDLVEP